MANLTLVELDVPGVQDNWVSFPFQKWTNNTKSDVGIKILQIAFASGSLIAEIACWVFLSDPNGSPQPTYGITENVRFVHSYGVECLAPPNQALLDRISFGDDEITVPVGASVYCVTNCGPVVAPGAMEEGLAYFCVLKFWHAPSK